jgi:hypothetical protein
VIQIIQRLYNSPSEILHGFDLGSSAVGFNGKDVIFTSLSKLSYEYSINVIDTSRRSTTYEKRLYKYFDKSFDIVMPNFNIRNLSNVNSKYNINDVCELPFLTFMYAEIKDNKILTSKLYNTASGGLFNDVSDYQLSDMGVEEMLKCNLLQLTKNDEFSFDNCDIYFASFTPENVMKSRPMISKRQVIDFYDTLKSRICDANTFNIGTIKSYIRNVHEVLNAAIDFGTNNIKFKNILDANIQLEKNRIIDMINKMESIDFTTFWKISDPGSQLTSSFNPIIADPNEWYGDYYTTTPCVVEMTYTTPLDDSDDRIHFSHGRKNTIEIECILDTKNISFDDTQKQDGIITEDEMSDASSCE